MIRENLKDVVCDLVDKSKGGSSTQLTRDNEALIVAKADLEGAHGFNVAHRELGRRLHEIIPSLLCESIDS